MLAHSKMYEYKDAGPNKPESATTVIDLRFASVREGRGTDRRFVFEIVTPSHGRRLYQALSEADMRTWIYALCNAIEACINGTSTLRSLHDVKKLGPDGGDDDDVPAAGAAGASLAALSSGPARKGSGQSAGSAERRLPIPPTMKPPASVNRHSLPAPPRGEAGSGSLSRAHAHPHAPTHRQSLKNRIKSSAELAGDRLGAGKARRSMDLQQRPAFMHAQSFSRDELADAESDIERRVYEMAGIAREPRREQASVLGLGGNALGHTSQAHLPQYPDTNVASVRTLSPVLGSPGLPPGLEGGPGGGEGAAAKPAARLDKQYLRQIADSGANARCADCGKRTKSSRWATQSESITPGPVAAWNAIRSADTPGLREMPMVMFLCIRCCGLVSDLGGRGRAWAAC